MIARRAPRMVSSATRILLLQLMLLAATGVAGCSRGESGSAVASPPTVTSGSAPQAASQPGRAVSGASQAYDLAGDEARGGHTLERHVGRTDAELAERLRRERQISAASTYTDAATAARVVGAALAANRAKVTSWAARSGSRPNLVLLYRDPGPGPIGRSLTRNARSSRPCANARLVLRWQDRDDRWMVLTSYPEAR